MIFCRRVFEVAVQLVVSVVGGAPLPGVVPLKPIPKSPLSTSSWGAHPITMRATSLPPTTLAPARDSAVA